MKKILLLAASAVVALASCTQSDEIFNGPDLEAQAKADNAITFSTYLGQGAQTRSGYVGNISTTELKENGTNKTNGFGVFAYYTGDNDYENFRAKTGEKYPNFMYNQNVSWTTSNDRSGYIGAESNNMWAYTPLKYWPNDIASTAVDDQTDPATGSATYGGKLSFFAYAPYVEVSSQTSPTSVAGGSVADNSYGIIAFSGNKYSGDGTRYSDPYITYMLKDDGTNVVDLLWGTSSMTTTKNVLDNDNNGVSSTASELISWATTATDYTDEILQGYKTAADMTKEKTNGTVDFAFKHALAKVGGSEKNGDHPSGSIHHGLMIITDIDDQKGEVAGGHRGTTTGVDNDTKVTVKDIKIVAKSKVNDGTNNPGVTGYTDTYLKVVQGLFNLATGKWEVTRTITAANDNVAPSVTGLTHEITTTGKDETNHDVAAKLNAAIAEPSSAPAKTAAGFNGITANVPDNAPVNVYDTTEGDANPLVFIPGTWPELTVTVEYCVRTKDPNLADAYSEVWQKITKKITFENPVELNKQYNLLIHLGLTSVKFTATVSKWDVETGTPRIDTNGDGTDDLQGQDVYVPINVQ